MLVGPTRLGKTAWARSLGTHMYMHGMFNLENWDDNARFLIIDDIEWTYFPAKKQLLGGQTNFVLSDKYRRKRNVIGGHPCIYLMNRDNWHEIEKDKMYEWIKGNSVEVFLENQLY